MRPRSALVGLIDWTTVRCAWTAKASLYPDLAEKTYVETLKPAALT